jgi:hypothetical protein
MRLHELAKASGVTVKPWMENLFHLENGATKQGVVEVADNGFIDFAYFKYFSKYIGSIEVAIAAPESAEAIEAYFTKYLGLILSMEQDIEEDQAKIDAMRALINLGGTLYIESDNIVFRFKGLGVISHNEFGWYVCPNGVDNTIHKTLAEATKAMAEYKASLEVKPVLLENII